MKFDYDLVYSARRSISVSISADNKITVRCPRGLNKNRVEKFLESKSEWIERNLNKNSDILASNRDIEEQRNVLINGQRYKLVFSDKNAVADGIVYLKNIKYLKQLLIKNFSFEFQNRVNGYAELMKVNPESVSFKNYKSRWGVCDCANNIIFNYKLLMLPKELQNYVIVHELGHIYYKDHSQKFWAVVQSFYPECKKFRRQLKNYAFLIALY